MPIHKNLIRFINHLFMAVCRLELAMESVLCSTLVESSKDPSRLQLVNL